LTQDSDAPQAASRPAPWWRESAVYQLYVRSFADSDGDGIGDLGGVADRLEHIAALGVDGFWLNPCYPSGGRDGGYDVADFTTIDPRYGGLPAFERLLDAAHGKGLKVLMDLVPNHCSAEHAWFQAAVAAAPGSPERARFLFRDGRGPDGAEPPNNWRSVFGGPAWTRLKTPDGAGEQWYFHAFDAGQPDFDWENPEVAAMFDEVLRLWFDRGVDGFRVDVAYAMVKAAGLPDLDDPAGENPHLWNQPGVHAIFPRWRAIADSYARELTLVGEVWLPAAELADYLRPGELDQAFYFDLLQQPFEASAFRMSITACLDALKHAEGGAPAWTLNSHDVHRSVTRYGLTEAEPLHPSVDAGTIRNRPRGTVDVALGVARAKAAALLLFALPGSVYLYQGEELGLPEVQDLPDDMRRDPIWERSNHREHGRDGCRVPLPWRAQGTNFGFSDGETPAAAWLPQPAWFGEFAVDGQEADPDSVLAFYRRALCERRGFDPGAALEWLELDRADAIAFRRGDRVCATVFGGTPLAVPAEWGPLIVSSQPVVDAVPANTTAWFRKADA
jgi:alpha-glucosidase